MGKQFLIFRFFRLYYLLIVFLLPWQPPLQADDRIDLDPTPQRVLPPPLDPEALDDDLAEKKRRRIERHEKMRPTKTASEQRNQRLAAEALKERDYTLMTQISLVIPTVITTAPRSQYTTDLSSHFSLFLRMFHSQAASDMQGWWGVRLAPFSGTGTYERTPGRYGFVYFGPMLGLGRINQSDSGSDAGEDEQRSAESEERAQVKASFPRRHGWFLMTGIAAQSRNVVTDPSTQTVDHDMNSVKGSKLDGLGLWAELTYSVIHFGAVGTHYVTGLQLGKGKVFLWMGVAAGAWY